MYKTYSGGTFRHGPLHQISLVGTVTEEVGGFFPKFLDLLEKNIFLKMTMPWGDMSVAKMQTPLESNDGPILWVRPGEQMLPTAELHANRSPVKRKRTGINELRVRTAKLTVSALKYLDFISSVWSSISRISNTYLGHQKLVKYFSKIEPGLMRITLVMV